MVFLWFLTNTQLSGERDPRVPSQADLHGPEFSMFGVSEAAATMASDLKIAMFS